jgi:hypothetical protein
MSPRVARAVFGLLVVSFGTVIVYALLFRPAPPVTPRWLGVLCELGVLVAGAAIAFTAPPDDYRPPSAAADVADATPVAASVYRGAQPAELVPPAHPITRASAQRLTIGIIGALLFTAAAVPFALHLPRWLEAEVVVGAWWSIWSVVLAVVAYRGTKVEDDHRPGSGRVVDLGGSAKLVSLADVTPDVEGCLVGIVVLAVVGLALLGAWLVAELVAPAVFIVAYRCVVRALAKAHAANTRGDALRSALSGIGWAAVGTVPLAGVVAIVHLLLRAS